MFTKGQCIGDGGPSQTSHRGRVEGRVMEVTMHGPVGYKWTIEIAAYPRFF